MNSDASSLAPATPFATPSLTCWTCLPYPAFSAATTPAVATPATAAPTTAALAATLAAATPAATVRPALATVPSTFAFRPVLSSYSALALLPALLAAAAAFSFHCPSSALSCTTFTPLPMVSPAFPAIFFAKFMAAPPRPAGVRPCGSGTREALLLLDPALPLRVLLAAG